MSTDQVMPLHEDVILKVQPERPGRDVVQPRIFADEETEAGVTPKFPFLCQFANEVADYGTTSYQERPHFDTPHVVSFAQYLMDHAQDMNRLATNTGDIDHLELPLRLTMDTEFSNARAALAFPLASDQLQHGIYSKDGIYCLIMRLVPPRNYGPRRTTGIQNTHVLTMLFRPNPISKHANVISERLEVHSPVAQAIPLEEFARDTLVTKS